MFTCSSKINGHVPLFPKTAGKASAMAYKCLFCIGVLTYNGSDIRLSSLAKCGLLTSTLYLMAFRGIFQHFPSGFTFQINTSFSYNINFINNSYDDDF